MKSISFTDQIGEKFQLKATPKRIISFVPSLTELLFDLGLNDEVIGITKFCFEPENWFKTKNRVGGTKTINLEKVKALKPDLIIANKEENDKEQVETLSKIFPTYTSNIVSVEEALKAIKDIGFITATSEKAAELTQKIQQDFETLHFSKRYKVAYCIWQEPLMVAGGNTFINTMLNQAGFDNVFANKERYPSVSFEDIADKNPDYVFLSSEPFPFKEKHLQFFETELSNAKPILVKGDMFSWYGSRMIYFKDYIHRLNKKL